MTQECRVGEKILRLREDLQISRPELAEKSLCSVQVIEQIESGRLLPALAPLMKIARALGVRLGTLLDDEVHDGPIITRAGNAESVMRFSNASGSVQSRLDFYALASHKKDRHMEPFLIELHPAADAPPELSSHEGEEFLYVLKGAVEVIYGKETCTLQEGDSVYYDSIVTHEVRAAGTGEARLLAVVYAPW